MHRVLTPLFLLAGLAFAAAGAPRPGAAQVQPLLGGPAEAGRKAPQQREWVAYATDIGWLRVGRLAEFEAKWQRKDEIWGGTGTEALGKSLVRKGYATRDEALAALCGSLTRVQLRIEPPTRGQPVRYCVGVLDGKEYFLRLAPGFDREAVEAMSLGRYFKGLEYDLEAELAVLRKHNLTPRHVFRRKQWLVHSVGFSTTEGPKAEDRWMCVTARPQRNEKGEPFVVLADGFGGTRTFLLREVEGPFLDNYALARVLKRLGVPRVDLWPPVTSAAGLDVQPRVAADEVPPNAKDYGDDVLPRQSILPDRALEDWVVYSVENAWLHVGTRHEYLQPLKKAEVIWAGTGDQPAAKRLLAPPEGQRFHSRQAALNAL